MSDKTLNSYPDFGELSKVFEAYKAGMRTEPLLAEGAIDSIFKDAPAKVTLMRRIRMQWAVGITGLVIVTAGFIMELSRTTEAPQQSLPVTVDTIAAAIKTNITTADTALQVEDFRLSKYNYSSRLNLDSVVRFDPNLGPDFREADFNDLIEYATLPGRVDTLIQTLNWPLLVAHGLPGGDDSIPPVIPDSMRNFYVSWRGKKWLMPDTAGFHYFVGRWDHHRPKWWTRYAQIDDDHICLGAWTELNFRVLAVRRNAAEREPINF
jgi:hypothetical protein